MLPFLVVKFRIYGTYRPEICWLSAPQTLPSCYSSEGFHLENDPQSPQEEWFRSSVLNTKKEQYTHLYPNKHPQIGGNAFCFRPYNP